MNEIKIVVDSAFAEREAKINRKTWLAIKTKKGDSAFFEGNAIMVGENVFDPQYILFIVDEDLPDNTMIVSKDVKEMCYADKDTLSF